MSHGQGHTTTNHREEQEGTCNVDFTFASLERLSTPDNVLSCPNQQNFVMKKNLHDNNFEDQALYFSIQKLVQYNS
jgi:hypothetical protein